MKTFHMLLFQIPNAFAWKLIPTSSALIGCFFLAASCYFLYGLLRPSWQNACGQLWAFLAYDLVLIIPFLLRFASVSPERLPSLLINTAVLVYSGALALYYLFVNKATRMWGNLLFNKPISRSSDLSLSSGKKPSRKKADSHRLTCDERDLSRNLCPKLRGGSQI